MKLRTIIVDDETPARKRLRKFLLLEPDLEIVGECAGGTEAVQCIRRQQPDLVFLDIQMPELSGLEVVRALPVGPLPVFVFVTAHERHAVEAFEIQAVDYLLKPFSRLRLQESLRRVRQRLHGSVSTPTAPVAVQVMENQPLHLHRFAVKDGHQMLFVKIEDVDYIEAAANYAVICTRHGNHVLRETLRNIETSLPSGLFLRISRSIIVKMDRIKAIRMELPGEWVVVLHGDRELAMTRGLKEVQKRMQYARPGPPPDKVP